MTEFFVFFGYL